MTKSLKQTKLGLATLIMVGWAPVLVYVASKLVRLCKLQCMETGR